MIKGQSVVLCSKRKIHNLHSQVICIQIFSLNRYLKGEAHLLEFFNLLLNHKQLLCGFFFLSASYFMLFVSFTICLYVIWSVESLIPFGCFYIHAARINLKAWQQLEAGVGNILFPEGRVELIKAIKEPHNKLEKNFSFSQIIWKTFPGFFFH